MQLLLQNNQKEEAMLQEIKDLREQCERVRKGQFAKIGHLTKMYNEIQHELETLKFAICRETNQSK